MLATNLKIIGVVIGTILLYTYVANVIPQVESAVPEELALGADVTPEELVAAGEQVYFGAGGCVACHTGATGARAPGLLAGEPGGNVGARCGERVPGMSCKEYLYRALIDPNAYVVEGYEPIMPDMGRMLSEAQLWALVAFMESQGGEVTVTAEDIQVDAAGDPGDPAPAAAGGPAVASASMDPLTLLRENQCLLCHVLGDEGGPIGPPLTGIGARRDAAFIRQAILDPNAEITPGYEALAGTMPTNFGEQMTAAQLEAMVEYLASQR